MLRDDGKKKFHLSRICRSIKRIIKRSGTARTTNSIIKSGQKDTEASIKTDSHENLNYL